MDHHFLQATKVACISLTESSIDMPQPSFRISTPNSLALAAAPYSLAAATVISKRRAWSEYQGRFLEGLDLGDRDVVELVDGGVDREGDVAGEGGVEDPGLVGGEVEVVLELGTAAGGSLTRE